MGRKQREIRGQAQQRGGRNNERRFINVWKEEYKIFHCYEGIIRWVRKGGRL